MLAGWKPDEESRLSMYCFRKKALEGGEEIEKKHAEVNWFYRC
jgi:hypothetical protein